MANIYKEGEILKCPHCDEAQDGPVQDFVIPGRVGEDSRADDECYECQEGFSVLKLANGSFQVEEI